MVLQKINEWRPEGARNFIRVGDVVKVLPSSPGKSDGFEARVREIAVDEAGEVRHLEVIGGSRGKVAVRFIKPERIARVAQLRTNGLGLKEKRERKR